MKPLNLSLTDTTSARLAGIAKWHNTSPEQAAKQILDEACLAIWKVRGSDIEEMQHGLEYFHKL